MKLATIIFAVAIASLQQIASARITEEEFYQLSIDVVMHREQNDSELKGSLHNGYARLIDYGMKKSVPFLIDDLTEANEAIKEAEEKNEGYICTWKHLHDALKAQTGEDFGFDQEAWRSWWNTKGKNLPEEHFNPKKNKEKVNQAVDTTAVSAPR
ncbi:hypothetical protein [Pelagicoccus albus]|uniref:Uncharacterized protein n=1 Tax=Pelagicoccus albus TaxID=415222 RepID=A0A7X1B650_9BACT|nr:hypothetical protein [Pelagicoccus albus]MBC2606325.1 hypothetical protein [Pelagicoccus albus]